MTDILIRCVALPEIKDNHGIKAELRRIDGRLELGFMTGGYSCCEQWTYYPIHELPPHGDLIDRDYIQRTLQPYSKEDEQVEVTLGTAKRLIQNAINAPVIVPAERSGDDA